jgi:hypothetical protein
MDMEEVGVGIPGGMVRQFHHGDPQQRRKRFAFSKKKPNTFVKS